jgi:hypothetical protein
MEQAQADFRRNLKTLRHRGDQSHKTPGILWGDLMDGAPRRTLAHCINVPSAAFEAENRSECTTWGVFGISAK